MTRSPVWFALHNGVRAVAIPDPKVHFFGFTALVRVGSRFERTAEQGLSHFLEHMIFQGSDRYVNAAEVSRHIEAIGGTMNAFTMPEYTCFYVTSHRDHWKEALGILSSLLLWPAFREEQIELERQIVLQELRYSVDHSGKNFNIDDLAYNLLWNAGDSDYSPIGKARRIRRFSRGDLWRLYDRFYRSGNIVLGLAGAFPPREAQRWIRNTYRAAPNLGVRPPKAEAAPLHARPRLIIRYADWPSVSVKLCYRAHPYSHPDFLPSMILDDILGGGLSSRLFLHLREGLGLVYDVTSEMVSFSDVGSLDISTTVEAGKLLRTLDEIFAVIDRLRREGVTADELDRVIQKVRYHMEMTSDDSSQLVEWYARQMLLGGGRVESLTQMARRLSRLTVGRINQVAREVLEPTRRNLALVGPVRGRLLREASRRFYHRS